MEHSLEAHEYKIYSPIIPTWLTLTLASVNLEPRLGTVRAVGVVNRTRTANLIYEAMWGAARAR